MSVEPIKNDPPGPSQRPELRVIRSEDVPPESDTEITAPIPVVDSDGKPVQPQAPLDVRIRDAALAALRNLPRLTERPPSFVESLEYSQHGDWTASDNGLKRAVHGLCTLLAYLLTYPLDIVIRVRAKPIGFVLTLAVLIVLINALS